MELREKSDKIKKDNKNKIFRLYILTILLFFFYLYMIIIGMHSDLLVKRYILISLEVLFVINFIINIYFAYRLFSSPKKIVLKLWRKILLGIFLTFYVGASTVFMFNLYHPKSKFKTWLITTAMTTMRHQYLCQWFYSPSEIDAVLAKNKVVDSDDITDGNLIKIGEYEEPRNPEEASILDRKPGEIYRIMDINYMSGRKKMQGKLAVIYEPKNVYLAVAEKARLNLPNSPGELVADMNRKYGAELGINGGGFKDPGNGGYALGVVIQNGKIVSSNGGPAGGMVGIDKEGRFILGRMDANQALAKGIVDAVEFGPYLIVNGNKVEMHGDGGWGESNRTAIGQRKDGIILMMVFDGRQWGKIPGATVVEVRDLMEKYGAINAGLMDGGTSSSMTLHGEVITQPRNSDGFPFTRPVPNAWLVFEDYDDIVKLRKGN